MPRPSRSSAAARAASVTVSPASMRAISSRRSARPSCRPGVGVAAARGLLGDAQMRSRRAPRPAGCASPPAPARARRRAPAARPPPPRWRRRCRIDLVEHQRRHRRPRRQHDLQRQHQPRQLAARGERASGAGSCPGLVAIRKRTASAPRGPQPPPPAAPPRQEARLVEPQRRQFLRDRALQPARPPVAPRRNAAAHATISRARLQRPPAPMPRPRPRRFPARPAGPHSVSSSAGSSATDHRMLARRRPQREQPLLGLLQQARIGVGLGRQPRQQGFRLGQRLLRPFQARSAPALPD